jgi:hypothetical protein
LWPPPPRRAQSSGQHGSDSWLTDRGRIDRSHRPSDAPENVDPAVLHRATDTVERLVRLIDEAVTAERRPRAAAS